MSCARLRRTLRFTDAPGGIKSRRIGKMHLIDVESLQSLIADSHGRLGSRNYEKRTLNTIYYLHIKLTFSKMHHRGYGLTTRAARFRKEARYTSAWDVMYLAGRHVLPLENDQF
jgi:hypothetical protein